MNRVDLKMTEFALMGVEPKVEITLRPVGPLEEKE